MAEPVTVLPESLVAQLQNETFVLLHTIDAESGAPTSNAISWVFAPDERTLRFAVDGRSRLVRNLTENPAVCVTVFAEGTVHAVYGRAAVAVDGLEGVPFKLVCFDIAVASVGDAMFYGARLSMRPEYEKTYDKRAAAKLDGQVFDAMRKA